MNSEMLKNFSFYNIYKYPNNQELHLIVLKFIYLFILLFSLKNIQYIITIIAIVD